METIFVQKFLSKLNNRIHILFIPISDLSLVVTMKLLQVAFSFSFLQSEKNDAWPRWMVLSLFLEKFLLYDPRVLFINVPVTFQTTLRFFYWPRVLLLYTLTLLTISSIIVSEWGFFVDITHWKILYFRKVA